MIDPGSLDWEKSGGLLPAIVQHAESGEVRMLGYMNRAALERTIESGWVTFWSRARASLWEKGATSGNRLACLDIRPDCDADALLLLARPEGPTCHTGSTSCFGESVQPPTGFLGDLARVVKARATAQQDRASYTRRLLDEGMGRIAQKVGEEGVETALAAVSGERGDIAAETADLLYHLTVMLEAAEMDWKDVMDVLRRRHLAESRTTASS